MPPRFWGTVAALLAAAPAPDRLAERARRLLEDPDVQRTLPGPRPPEPPRWHWPDWLTLPSEPVQLLSRLLLWALVAVAVALVVVLLYRRLSTYTRDAAAPEEAGPAAPADIPIASAEALAAAGRWDEAIHALLLDTLQALSSAARLAPSLTSREILAQVRLPAPAREALAGLVLAVEVSRFGGERPGPAEYQGCLAQFRAFLASYRAPRARAAPGEAA